MHGHVKDFFETKPGIGDVNALIEIVGHESRAHEKIIDLARQAFSFEDYRLLTKPDSLLANPHLAAVEAWLRIPVGERGPLSLFECIDAIKTLRP